MCTVCSQYYKTCICCVSVVPCLFYQLHLVGCLDMHEAILENYKHVWDIWPVYVCLSDCIYTLLHAFMSVGVLCTVGYCMGYHISIWKGQIIRPLHTSIKYKVDKLFIHMQPITSKHALQIAHSSAFTYVYVTSYVYGTVVYITSQHDGYVLFTVGHNCLSHWNVIPGNK